MAGRRPTESTNAPAGPIAIVWATAAQANAIPVHDGGRSSTSTTSTGTSAERTPCAGPARRQIGQAGRLEPGVPQHRRGRAGPPAGRRPERSARPRLQQQQPHRAGHHQRAGVEEERRGQRDQGQQTARPPDPVIPPSRNPPWNTPIARPRRPGSTEPSSRRHRRHGEHRRADAADAAQHQQLGVALGDPGQSAGDGHDEDAGGQDRPLPGPGDQPAAERAGHQPHQGEHRDHRADRDVADPEGPREHRQHRHQDPEPDRHAERDHAEDQDVAGESRSGCGAIAAPAPISPPA